MKISKILLLVIAIIVLVSSFLKASDIKENERINAHIDNSKQALCIVAHTYKEIFWTRICDALNPEDRVNLAQSCELINFRMREVSPEAWSSLGPSRLTQPYRLFVDRLPAPMNQANAFLDRLSQEAEGQQVEVRRTQLQELVAFVAAFTSSTVQTKNPDCRTLLLLTVCDDQRALDPNKLKRLLARAWCWKPKVALLSLSYPIFDEPWDLSVEQNPEVHKDALNQLTPQQMRSIWVHRDGLVELGGQGNGLCYLNYSYVAALAGLTPKGIGLMSKSCVLSDLMKPHLEGGHALYDNKSRILRDLFVQHTPTDNQIDFIETACSEIIAGCAFTTSQWQRSDAPKIYKFLSQTLLTDPVDGMAKLSEISKFTTFPWWNTYKEKDSPQEFCKAQRRERLILVEQLGAFNSETLNLLFQCSIFRNGPVYESKFAALTGNPENLRKLLIVVANSSHNRKYDLDLIIELMSMDETIHRRVDALLDTPYWLPELGNRNLANGLFGSKGFVCALMSLPDDTKFNQFCQHPHNILAYDEGDFDKDSRLIHNLAHLSEARLEAVLGLRYCKRIGRTLPVVQALIELDDPHFNLACSHEVFFDRKIKEEESVDRVRSLPARLTAAAESPDWAECVLEFLPALVPLDSERYGIVIEHYGKILKSFLISSTNNKEGGIKLLQKMGQAELKHLRFIGENAEQLFRTGPVYNASADIFWDLATQRLYQLQNLVETKKKWQVSRPVQPTARSVVKKSLPTQKVEPEVALQVKVAPQTTPATTAKITEHEEILFKSADNPYVRQALMVRYLKLSPAEIDEIAAELSSRGETSAKEVFEIINAHNLPKLNKDGG